MKKISLFFVALLTMLCVATTVQAQENKDFYAGKWKITTTGLPDGDQTMTIELKRGEDGKFTGKMIKEGSNEVPFTRVEEKAGKSITVYFTSGGYDCYLFLEKKDENKVQGSLMDMFDCIGIRIVDNKYILG